jgi:dTDP-4-amino-4,6-dideoxygalactose transaminase
MSGETHSSAIPLVDLRRQYEPLKEQIDRALGTIFEGMNLFIGPNVRGFEQEFAEYLDAREVVGVSDGTTALHLALRACGIGPGDEVITVSHTFFATVEAIMLAGARPVFVDIDPTSLTMDVAGAERAITSRTRALMPVHLYGRVSDMSGISALARRHGLRVIEDACQAHGARQDGRAAGTFGDAGCFSFYYSKNLGAYGEAGGVVTSDPDIARRVRMLRDHGSEVRYYHEVIGMNARLDELQAAVLRVKLPHLDAWNQARVRHARTYNSLLADLPLERPEGSWPEHVFHLFVIQTEHRDQLREYLSSRGIHTGIHYPVPCHRQVACSPHVESQMFLPATEVAAKRVLSLPMFPELREDEIRRVARTVRRFFDEMGCRHARDGRAATTVRE